jgi:hypothetical protein
MSARPRDQRHERMTSQPSQLGEPCEGRENKKEIWGQRGYCRAVMRSPCKEQRARPGITIVDGTIHATWVRRD